MMGHSNRRFFATTWCFLRCVVIFMTLVAQLALVCPAPATAADSATEAFSRAGSQATTSSTGKWSTGCAYKDHSVCCNGGGSEQIVHTDCQHAKRSGYQLFLGTLVGRPSVHRQTYQRGRQREEDLCARDGTFEPTDRVDRRERSAVSISHADVAI